MLYFIFCRCQPNELIVQQLVVGDGTREKYRESSQKGPEPVDWEILSFGLAANQQHRLSILLVPSFLFLYLPLGSSYLDSIYLSFFLCPIYLLHSLYLPGSSFVDVLCSCCLSHFSLKHSSSFVWLRQLLLILQALFQRILFCEDISDNTQNNFLRPHSTPKRFCIAYLYNSVLILSQKIYI